MANVIWPRKTSIAVLVATLLIGFASFAANAVGRIHIPGPPIQDLLLGTWDIRVTHEPSAAFPKGHITRGREVWRLGPAGRSLIEEYEENDPSGATHEFGIAWWDAEDRGQKVLWCGDYQPAGCFLVPGVARWEGDSLVQTTEADEPGTHVVRQEIFTDIKVNSFKQILKEGPSIGELKVTTTILATRRPSASTHSSR